MPTEWIDKDTGDKVMCLVNRKSGNHTFYSPVPFFDNKEGTGNYMFFYRNTPTKNQIFLFDMENTTNKQVTAGYGKKKGEILNLKIRKVTFKVTDSVFATNRNTGETEFIYKFPLDVIDSICSFNSNESLLGGALITKKGNEISQVYPEKSDYFNIIYVSKLTHSLIIIDVETEKMKTIYSENARLNHIQNSPTETKILIYCHKGPWYKVRRIWRTNIETGENQLIHNRTENQKIARLEFFSQNEEQILYDLLIPRGETFYMASKSVGNQNSMLSTMTRGEWSIFFNIAQGQKTFAGDWGDEGLVAHAKDSMLLNHFILTQDSLHSEKLVNMKHHDYDLESNLHFSLDGKSIIFRANFEVQSKIYEV